MSYGAKDYDKAAEVIKKHRRDRIWLIRKLTGIDPHPGQKTWVLNAIQRENFLVTGNRFGKSEITGANDLVDGLTLDGWSGEMILKYRAMNEPYRVVNIAMTLDQAKIVWTKALNRIQGAFGDSLIRRVKFSPFPSMELVTGAIFEARSTAGKAERLLGNVYDRVSWDEVAREPRFLEIRSDVVLMRTLDRKGRIYYVSTGNGRNDFGKLVLKALDGKTPGIYAQQGRSFENPHIPSEDLPALGALMSDRLRRQNIDGEIVDSGGTFFPGGDVDAARMLGAELDVVAQFDSEDRESHAIVYVDGDPNDTNARGREWVARYPNHRYVHGWDLADKSDWTVGTTWDVTDPPYTLVEFERFNRTGWAHVWHRIRVRHQKYGYSTTFLDSTGVGDVAVDELSDIDAVGVKFTASSKPELLGNIQNMLSQRELRVPPIRVWDEEMRWYEREDKNLVTDCVMSTAVAGVGMRGSVAAYASEI